mmetsp:Transcript_24770/g.59807  ORF Transcript_24770/g.59807 Transcript_24770/m.59807 type:complete len:81 (-) Transcript_24770:449-691(-)
MIGMTSIGMPPAPPPPPSAHPPPAALPYNWQEVSSPQGTYFYNNSTGQTTWVRPGAAAAPPPPTAPKVPFAARLIGMGRR